jgi:lysyl-tRNA synthetase class 2
LLEWYRAEAPYEQMMHDCLALLRIAAETAGNTQMRWRDRACDPFADAERLTVREAFRRISSARDALSSEEFSRILVAHIEPHLGIGAPTLLDEYPISEAALARPCAHDPRCAERFELYACGVELANGFGELTDPAEQRRRLEAAMREKERRYGARWPIDEDFLAALAHMPPASGCALGVDRLVMLAVGAPAISHVLWTPPP